MKITTIFKDESDAPITGLTPLITINDITDINAVVNVINVQNMTDIWNGFYAYVFTGYEQGKEYSVYIDANSDIENRYQYGTLEKIDQFEFLNDLDTNIENNISIKEMIRVMFSVLTGTSSGGGTNTIKFKSNDATRDRIIATVDDKGNRLNVTIDAE